MNNSAAASAPLEICILIFDDLQTDRPTLRSCILTCRAWVNAARIYLFRTVNLTKKSFPDFRAIVHGAPAVGLSVRVLRLDVNADPHFEILQHLPNVTHLTLSDWILKHEVNDVLAARLGKLNTLELEDFNIMTTELPRILSSCKELSSLSLREVYWPLSFKTGRTWFTKWSRLPSDAVALVPEKSLRVQSLSVSACTKLVYDLLIRGATLGPSPCLTLTNPDPDTEHVRRLFDHWAPSASSLKLSFRDAREEPPSLAVSTELLSLTLDRTPLKYTEDLRKLPAWLSKVLKSVESSRFRYLRVIVTAGWLPKDLPGPWQPVLAELSRLASRSGGVEFVFELRAITKDASKIKSMQDELETALVPKPPSSLDVNIVVIADKNSHRGWGSKECGIICTFVLV
ncbi:uncharacterized protein B0H18DRAFT_953199 [Fomitopsis serialis]|uniref:uncharacterized protein n=1 Tax=Fomitopsis serialis TaxID=139415 RepID=UPI0020078535|nr:uncharacterized protein B0H18DRAFT_953199 [Neoantrodia serialis]KAH9930271.1 hypothetical protein B0H18DRAFT_953199 [Neoantrodia serialis]